MKCENHFVPKAHPTPEDPSPGTDDKTAFRFWYGVVTFGMALHIPKQETETCRRLMAPAWIAVGLQNDLWSWPKERDEAARKGDDHVINAIWVLIQEHNTDVEGAQRICRDLIKKYVAEYVQIIRDTRDDESLSSDLRKYIEAFQYAISGNVVWSLTCPRYNPDATFNDTQLKWMHNGVPALSVGSPSQESTQTSDSPQLSTSSLSQESLEPTVFSKDIEASLSFEVWTRPFS